jgi:hypothetical protein
MKLPGLVLLCGITLSGGRPSPAHERPLMAERFSVSLEPVDDVRYERVPAELRATIRNHTRADARLFPVLKPMYNKYVYIYYRRVPEDFVLLRYTAEWEDSSVSNDPDVTPLRLPADGTDTYSFSLAVDPSRGAFMFDRPGEYELKIVYDLTHDIYSPRDVLETPPLRLIIEPAPPSEAAALADWDVDLATFAQNDGGRGGPHRRREVTRALRFMDKHPSSLYSRLLRRRTLDTLYELPQQGVRLTDYEKEAFERLKESVMEEARAEAARRANRP